MKSNKIIILFLAVFAILLSVGGYYFGMQSNNGSKQGFVSNSKLFEKYDGRRESSEALDALIASHKYLLDSMTTAISMMPEKKSEELEEKKKQVLFYHQVAKDFEQEQQETSAKYQERIWKQLNQYVYDYGKKNGYTYIYGAQQNGSLMYAEESQDITEDLIEYANRKYSGRE